MLDTTELRYYAAELYRLQGALLLQSNVQGPTSKVSVGAAREPPVDQEAEAYFQKALDIARQQQAKSFELRAATSLARLWQSQGKRQDAYALLAPVYHWFTKGFDTQDLQEARALVDALTEGQP